MKRLVLLFLVLLVLGTSTLAHGQAEREYIIGPGDILDIQVWGFDELSSKSEAKGFIVRPDGKIAFPLIGEQQAEGMAPQLLSINIRNALAQYLKDPKVTVNIIKFRTVRVYVLGEINRPGLYELEKQHNLLDGIGAAGGYTKDTAKRQVFIVKKDSKGPPQKVDLLKILRDGDMSQNMELGDGDIVYLTSNKRLDFTRDILPFISGAYYIRHFDQD